MPLMPSFQQLASGILLSMLWAVCAGLLSNPSSSTTGLAVAKQFQAGQPLDKRGAAKKDSIHCTKDKFHRGYGYHHRACRGG
eukprot:6277759-Karenia_brevis.AAC.1